MEAVLFVGARQHSGLGALLRQHSGSEVDPRALGDLVLEFSLGPKHVRCRPCLGESETAVLVVVLGLEVAGDGSLGIPDETDLEGYARGRGGLDLKSGAVDGEILAEEVIGGLSEVLEAEKRVRNKAGDVEVRGTF